MSKYQGKSSVVLAELLEYARADLEKLKKKAKAVTKALLQACANPSTSSTTTKDYEAYRIRGAISDRVRQISVFHGSGPQELSQFLEKLKQVYSEYVSTDTTAYEASFVRDVKCQLSSGIHSNLVNSGETIASFDQFKIWLRKTYDSQLTAFQLLGSAWDAEYEANDKFIIYAQTVEKELRTARDFILADYEKRNSTAMTAEQVFDLVGAMLMTEKLKAHHPTIYRAMVKQMDGLETATAVATPAECYRDRFGPQPITGEHVYLSKNGATGKSGDTVTISRAELDRIINQKLKSVSKADCEPDENQEPNRGRKNRGRKGKTSKTANNNSAFCQQASLSQEDVIPTFDNILDDIMNDQDFAQ